MCKIHCVFLTCRLSNLIKKLCIPLVKMHVLVKHSAIALEEVCQCWGALGLKAAEINVPAAALPLRAALGQGRLQGHSAQSCWAGAAPHCEHTALGHQAWPSHRNKPQEPYKQYNLNANLSNYTRLQREIRAQTNQLAAQTAADMQVWGVFCPRENRCCTRMEAQKAVLCIQVK